MALPTGSRIGPYELGPLIGEGGGGAVYRARDTRLGRDVAVKVLPEALTDDEERLLRFEREARLLASMSHPNIAVVHGLEELEGVNALIMELVEGRTLADRLAQGGPLRVQEALDIGRQVCEALEAAHERGIVHRDLKPANVMLRPDGKVKVLDFGLAKPVSMESGRAGDPVEPPTRTPETRSGTILGTPPYMSPEQLEGGPADPRTDVWAFGCLLYEMLVGRSPFSRSTVWQSVAAVLEQEPDLDRLPGGTPWRVRPLLERCLRKDPHRRLHHIADARIEIEEALVEGEASGWNETAGRHRSRRRARIRNAIAVAALVVAAMALGWGLSRDGSVATGGADPLTFTVPLPSGVTIGPGEVSTYLAVSPDGRRLAFTGTSSGDPLWIHELSTGNTVPLEGTEGAASPFWSPDGRLIGFFAEGQLKKVALDGGPPETISDAAWEAGNTWSADGVILFAQPVEGGIAIHRVSEDGGTPTPVTEVDPEGDFHFWPHFLPDGRHFLYLAIERSSDPVPRRTLRLASLDGGEPRPLLSSVSRAVYAPPGVLLYVSEGVLVAHPFDAERLELTGEPRPVTDRLRYFYMTGQAEFSASRAADNPVIAFHGGPWRSRIQRYDREGRTLGPLADPAAFDQIRISPDGTRAVVDVLDPSNGGRDLWVYDLATTTSRRLTLHPADEQDPVWSPDGQELLYRSDVNGPPDLYVRSAMGSGTPRPVLRGGAVFTPDDWSAQGRSVYQVASRSTGLDQWIFDVDGEGDPRALLDTPYTEWGGSFSPDGRWIAFVSDESGASQIYVAPVDDPGARRAITTSGGIEPRWRSDGEIVFLGPGRTVMAVDVRTEPSFAASEPRLLFELDAPVYQASYDVSPDGRLFLVNEVLEDASRAPIQVIMNWHARGTSPTR